MKPLLIVSFTSYPARIYAVPQVLESLYAQSMKPDKILLWLAEEQFPGREADLPNNLVKDAVEDKFELRWCDDIGSHKKYFYAMQEFPDDIIVTVDDDMYYDTDMIRRLYESYQRYSNAVSANCVSLMLFDADGNLLPCSRWIIPFQKICGKPSMQLMAIGSRGILYPPHSCDSRAFDKLAIKKYCNINDVLFNDDSWLKVHEILAGVPVVYVDCGNEKSIEIPMTQKAGLRHGFHREMLLVGRETEMWRLLCDFYGGEDGLSQQLFRIGKDTLFQEEDAVLCNAICRVQKLAIVSGLSEHNIVSMDVRIWPIHYSLLEINRQQSNGISSEKLENAIKAMRKALKDLPDIKGLCDRFIAARALTEYGAILRDKLWGYKFRTPPCYLQMLSNWREFLVAHPRCDKRYLDGYEHFLKDMNVAIAEMEQNGASAEELAKCQSVLEIDWALWHRPESKYIRLKKWFYNSRCGHVLSKMKPKVIRVRNQDEQK